MSKDDNGKRTNDEALMAVPVDLDPLDAPPTAPEEEASDEGSKPGAQRHLDIRRFRLKRHEDESGISGTGYIAEGVQFSSGACVIKWLTATSCVGIYHSYVEMIHIHGHGGKTVIEWIDEGFES